ncbi:MAG: diphthine--ammonia ligase [Halodesulfurarchaeum sp.]
MPSGQWVSLFSGGKDSSWALYRALEEGLPVGRLLTVHPTPDSYLYHVPATDLASLAAESINIPLMEVEETEGTGHDASSRGDAELQVLERALADLDTDLAGGLAGVIAGAVESEYQTGRIRSMCERLGVDLYAPLWRRDPVALGESMIAAGFDIRIIQVAAAGLERSWLGRRLDRQALDDLQELSERYGVHVLGEGGEFETLVVDGPHMDRAIRFDADPVWEGNRGHLDITGARLESEQ